MKFNNFLWSNFLESKEGERSTQFFVELSSILRDEKQHQTILEYLDRFKIEKIDPDYIQFFAEEVNCFLDEAKDISINSIEEAKTLFINIIDATLDDQNGESNHENLSSLLDDIDIITTSLYLKSPNYFFPYLFNSQFYLLKNIFLEFGVFIPPVPSKRKRRERALYYWDLCESLKTFCKNNQLNFTDIPIFLYGFAVNVIEISNLPEDMPKPRKAFFVGGGKNNNGDFEYLDKANENTIYNWQGNPDAQPGDIIVMYCLSPRSYIHSIWRAVTPGSIDPFFSFYRNVYIGLPIQVPPVTHAEIKADKILSKMSLVKANMQGINGREIDKKSFERILFLLEKKGQNIDTLPKLENVEINVPDLKNERDVEVHLLEPLLLKLGYTDADWQRQVTIKIGRKERIIPDYVLFPVLEKSNEKAFWIWEAKYSICNNAQLQDDFDQARSYALRLKCNGLGLVSKEGVWVTNGSLDFGGLNFWAWHQIEQRDTFNNLFNIAGKKKIF